MGGNCVFIDLFLRLVEAELLLDFFFKALLNQKSVFESSNVAERSVMLWRVGRIIPEGILLFSHHNKPIIIIGNTSQQSCL